MPRRSSKPAVRASIPDKWCEDGVCTPAIVADGLPPPQCLLDFLDGGGSANAHRPREEWMGDTRMDLDTLLQLSAESVGIPAGPRVVKLLLQRGADVRGAVSRASPLERAARYWLPITKPYPECARMPVSTPCIMVSDCDALLAWQVRLLRY